MAISFVYAIFCDKASVDEIDKKLSCTGFVDQVETNVVPTTLGLYFVLGVSGIKTGSEFNFSLRIRGPQDKIIGKTDIIRVPGGQKHQVRNIILDLRDAPIPRTGTYWVDAISPEGEVIFKRAILVRMVRSGDDDAES